ncbi:hypothetical protein [Methylobacterium sp. J-067]|jgi:hypothetical protein|uniref:hypothetical protein n=1 Tax=Methylobacterium sp. J-067 TaxID=2836648 RepID=UPI001FB88A3B|nr:hypothetical protein [Methylobacterium sp. J-067]MCJ2024710.1 hypothetical protein [Methylobacterium sp. J-067]
MVYRIQINQIGKAGVPNRQLTSYEADTEMEAVALAAYEVDITRPAVSRIATVFAPSGALILAYVGRVMAVAGDER